MISRIGDITAKIVVLVLIQYITELTLQNFVNFLP